jgi:tetratricopeptide (TPR) repeat protein
MNSKSPLRLYLLLWLLSLSLYASPKMAGASDDAPRRYGIGVGYGLQDGKVIVKQVIAGSPAETAGIQAGDELLEANNVPLIGVAENQISSLIGGKENSDVVLAILRNGKVIQITAKRSFNISPKTGNEWQVELEKARKTGDKERVLLCLLNLTSPGLFSEPPIDPRPYRDEAWALAHEIIPKGSQKWIIPLTALGAGYAQNSTFINPEQTRAKLTECYEQLLSITAASDQTPLASADHLLYFANRLDIFNNDEWFENKSLELTKRCLAIAETHHAPPEQIRKYLNKLIWPLQRSGNDKQAATYAERALALTEASLYAPRDLQQQIERLAQLYELQKRWDEAIQLRLRVVNMIKQQKPSDVSVGRLRSPLQGPLIYLARDYEDAGKFSDALSTYQQVVEIEKQFPAENSISAQMRTQAKIGVLELKLGNLEKAEGILQPTLSSLSENELADVKLNLAKIYAAKNRTIEAQKCCQEILAIYRTFTAKMKMEVAELDDRVAESGKILHGLKKDTDALIMYDSALLGYKRLLYQNTTATSKPMRSYTSDLYRHVERIMNDYVAAATSLHKSADVNRVKSQIDIIKRDNYDPEVLKTSVLPVLYTGTIDPNLKLRESLSPPAPPKIPAMGRQPVISNLSSRSLGNSKSVYLADLERIFWPD